jgi:putative NADH-flavin reductase
VVRLAREAGHEVTALARNPAVLQDEGLTVAQGDVLDQASLDRAVAGQDAVVSCLGTRDRKNTNLRTDGIRNLVAAMSGAGARRLIVFSAFGVGDSRAQLQRTTFMFGRIILPLFLAGQFDDMARMEEIVRASSLEWVIARPTALTDKPARGDVKVVTGSHEKVGSSIPLADVAAFMVAQLDSDAYLRQAPIIYS